MAPLYTTIYHHSTRGNPPIPNLPCRDLAKLASADRMPESAQSWPCQGQSTPEEPGRKSLRRCTQCTPEDPAEAPKTRTNEATLPFPASSGPCPPSMPPGPQPVHGRGAAQTDKRKALPCRGAEVGEPTHPQPAFPSFCASPPGFFRSVSSVDAARSPGPALHRRRTRRTPPTPNLPFQALRLASSRPCPPSMPHGPQSVPGPGSTGKSVGLHCPHSQQASPSLHTRRTWRTPPTPNLPFQAPVRLAWVDRMPRSPE